MKAAFRTKYGPPEVLQIRELPIPIPKENEVLIRIHAASVNRSDYHILTGKPFLMRLLLGLSKPRSPVTGCDFAGQIEAIGKEVKSFKAGDKVMGFGGALGTGSHAQFLAFPETKGIVLMPENITYEQAAGCLEGAYYAAAVITKLNPQPGQKALVYGATGAIGSAYVQYLKYLGVYTTAVCPGAHKALMISLGADKVIDYETEDFTKDTERYEFVFDAVGKSSFLKCKGLLKEKGMFFPSGGAGNIFLVPITKLLGGKRVMFTGSSTAKPILDFIRDLLEKGSFKPVIDRIYPLEKIAEAYAYVGSGRKIGNVIVKMEQ
jgi:NADPH:quinone reductase-like Zn-dependent oxidoreductase